VSLAGTGPPAVPPEERSPVGTATVEAVEVRTPAATAGAGRRAPAGRSVPEEPAVVVPRPATWAPGAGASRLAPAGRSGAEGRYRRPRRWCSPTTPARPGGDRRRGPRRGDTTVGDPTGPGQGTGPRVGPSGGERVPAERGRIGGSTTASVEKRVKRSRSGSEEGGVVVEE
jgi:hypothetical protein